MELLQMALVVMAAILISAAFEPFLSRVALPLVQVLVGILLYFFIDMPADFTIESDLLLVLLIAPLLFDESKNADTRELFANMGSVLSLAVGLVLAIVLTVGFTLHLLVPSVPLAAAFALGAALGPTDAVAVAALSKDIKLGSRQRAQLTGEALLNDASGVVSFQFAIAAAVTGAFSMAEASITFVVEFIGGIVVGVVIALLAYFIVRLLRRNGVESTTFHICYEIFLPFFSYIVASAFDTSGVLAVVACGLVFSWMPKLATVRTRKITSFSARVNIASENVWNILSFVFNGIIFVYLGFKLPSTLMPAIQETELNTIWIVGIALVVTLVVIATRLVWILVMDLISKNPEADIHQIGTKQFFINALVTTLSGPKGAVSLSIALTIPTTLASGESMPVRDFLLFIACMVIILTLLLANFAVPVLSPDDEDDQDGVDARTEIEIVDNVIKGLRAGRTEQNKHATYAVIRNLSERKAALQRNVASNKQLRFLRQEVLEEQESYIKGQLEDDELDQRMAESYLKRIEKMKERLRKKNRSQSEIQNKPLASSTAAMTRIQERVVDTPNAERRRLEFKIGIEQVAVSYLERETDGDDKERRNAAKALLSEHKPLLTTLEVRLSALDSPETLATGGTSPVPVVRSETGTLHLDRDKADDAAAMLEDVRAEALRLELDEIQTMNEAGRISNATARSMRNEVYLLQMGFSLD